MGLAVLNNGSHYKLLRNSLFLTNCYGWNLQRCISMKIKPKRHTYNLMNHDEKNMRLRREMSPHLTIYKPQLTSMLSITHRFAGLALSGYACTLGIAALLLPHDFQYYITMIDGMGFTKTCIFVLKYSIALPTTYHTFNGIRHLLWDTGRFLTLKEVYSTGYAMLGISFITAAVLTMFYRLWIIKSEYIHQMGQHFTKQKQTIFNNYKVNLLYCKLRADPVKFLYLL